MKDRQLALDLPPGKGRRADRRDLPRLDLIQWGLSLQLMRGEKVRYAPRFRVWVSDHGRAWRHDQRNAWARRRPWRFIEATMKKRTNGYVGAYWPEFARERATLVADAWHGPKPPGLVVRHLDDDPLNDAAWNLRYGTHRDNYSDAIRNGRRPPRKMEKPQIIGALLTMRAGETDAACAARNSVTVSTITKIRNGRRYAHIAPCLPRRAEWKAMQQ